jgi:hypothetical protein
MSKKEVEKKVEADFAFVVTVKSTNVFQQNLLSECVRHIRALYATRVIYLLNDNSTVPLLYEKDENIFIYPALVQGAGEVNAYLFALDPRCAHDMLVFIHDSVFIKRHLPIPAVATTTPMFVPFWYSHKFVWTGIFTPQNSAILKSLCLYNNNNNIINNNRNLLGVLNGVKTQSALFAVTFGAMGLFNRAFVQFMRTKSNMWETAHLFKSRPNRCLFERIISVFHMWLHNGQTIIHVNSVCGDIFQHPKAFRNTNMNVTSHSSLIKVWQGR